MFFFLQTIITLITSDRKLITHQSTVYLQNRTDLLLQMYHLLYTNNFFLAKINSHTYTIKKTKQILRMNSLPISKLSVIRYNFFHFFLDFFFLFSYYFQIHLTLCISIQNAIFLIYRCTYVIEEIFCFRLEDRPKYINSNCSMRSERNISFTIND